jgi:hypothetical protein
MRNPISPGNRKRPRLSTRVFIVVRFLSLRQKIVTATLQVTSSRRRTLAPKGAESRKIVSEIEHQTH